MRASFEEYEDIEARDTVTIYSHGRPAIRSQSGRIPATAAPTCEHASCRQLLRLSALRARPGLQRQSELDTLARGTTWIAANESLATRYSPNGGH